MNLNCRLYRTSIPRRRRGSHRNFIGKKRFYYGLNTATSTVEGCQSDYKPKIDADVHATSLVGHLKRKHSNLYSEAFEEDEKNKPKASNIISYFESQSQGTSSATVGI